MQLFHELDINGIQVVSLYRDKKGTQTAVIQCTDKEQAVKLIEMLDDIVIDYNSQKINLDACFFLSP